jgi:hypothetical protein
MPLSTHPLLLEMATLRTLSSTLSHPCPGDAHSPHTASIHLPPLPGDGRSPHTALYPLSPCSRRRPLASHCPLPYHTLLLELATTLTLTSICSLPTPGDGHSPHIASTVPAHSLLLEMATLLKLPSIRSLPTPGDRPLSSHCPLPAHSLLLEIAHSPHIALYHLPPSWRWPLSSHCPLPAHSLLLEIDHSPHIALYHLPPSPGGGHSPHIVLYPLTPYSWR